MTSALTHCCNGLLGIALALTAGDALAHKASDAYLYLSGGGANPTQLRFDLALRDLDVALDLDSNGDGRLTWREVKAGWPAIQTYVEARLRLDGCPLQLTARTLERRSDGVYAALHWQANCRPTHAPSIQYAILAQVDPTHRGIARIEWSGSEPVLRVLVAQPTALANQTVFPPSAVETTAMRTPTTPQALAPDAFQFTREGVRHIVTGYDHVLFLICLLLPAMMWRTPRGWLAREGLSEAAWPLAGLVTAFTAAHSITLALASTGMATLTPAVIEPAIAATIVLAALDNWWPIFRGRRAVAAFAFGLIHGFGFAGVLSELNLPAAQFAWALLQFNLGLELGQLLIVAGCTVVLFPLRHWSGYGVWLIRGGSLAAMLVGLVWFAQRLNWIV